MILSTKPALIISRCLIKPLPKTIAFGGVATGSINAQEAPTPITTTKSSGGKPICVATPANTGTNNAAEAVLLVNSVRIIIKTHTMKITIRGWAPKNVSATS